MDNYDDVQNGEGEMDPIAIARRARARAFDAWRTAETAALRAPLGTALRQELRQAMDQAFDRLCTAENIFFKTLEAARTTTEQTRPREENRG